MEWRKLPDAIALFESRLFYVVAVAHATRHPRRRHRRSFVMPFVLQILRSLFGCFSLFDDKCTYYVPTATAFVAQYGGGRQFVDMAHHCYAPFDRSVANADEERRKNSQSAGAGRIVN